MPVTGTLLRRRVLLLRLAFWRKPIRIARGTITLELAHRDDEQVIQYMLHGEYWRRCDESVFRPLITPGDVVVDIGSNVGFVTVILARLVGPTGRVVAIEPCQTTFTQLLRTLELNAPLSVTPMNLACGAFAGRAEMYAISQSSGLNTLCPPRPPLSGNGEPVLMEPLDCVVQQLALQKVNFIKVDVEGYEANVLRGATLTLERFRPRIYLEVSDTYRDQSREACGFLRSLGYTLDITHDELEGLRGVRNVLGSPP